MIVVLADTRMKQIRLSVPRAHLYYKDRSFLLHRKVQVRLLAVNPGFTSRPSEVYLALATLWQFYHLVSSAFIALDIIAVKRDCMYLYICIYILWIKEGFGCNVFF